MTDIIKEVREEIAEELVAIKPTDYQQSLMWETVVESIADVCRRHNSNFNRSRFYEACGYETS